MKKIFLSALLIFTAISLFADTRSLAEATEIAKQYLQQASSLPQRRTPADMTLTYAATQQKTHSDEAAFYALNIQNGGFIIVSADTRSQAVLAYTEQGEYNENDMPDNVSWWLQQYVEQLSAAEGVSPIQKTTTAAIAPLLDKENIRWAQTEPFNANCPKLGNENCATGCVATAYAQIMRYWKYPSQGTGNHSYTWQGTTISANFAAHTYLWNNMPGNYVNYTNEEAKAVAQLMSDLGVVCEMNYGLNASSSNELRGAMGLITYFGYDAAMQVHLYDLEDDATFRASIVNDLSAERPVLMSGKTESGAGHAFVCDGVDANGLMHINWGWGGFFNGYYALTALRPEGTSTGGGKAGESYNINLHAITGIQPDQGNSMHSQVMADEWNLETDARIGRNDNIQTSFTRLSNYGLGTWQGSVGIVLCTPQQQVVENMYVSNTLSLQMFQFFYTLNTPSFRLPQTVANGHYVLVPIYSSATSENWEQIAIPQESLPILELTVTSDSIFFYLPEKEVSPYMSNLQAVDKGNDTALFTWDAQTKAAAYMVEVRYQDITISRDTVSTTECIVPFYLSGNRSYKWRLTALDENKEILATEKGNDFSVNVNGNYAPTGLKAEMNNDGILFSWNGKAQYYQLEIIFDGNVIYRGNVKGNGCVLPDPRKGVYNWSVRALNQQQNIYVSDAATATFTYDDGKQHYLKNLSANINGDETVTFSWQADIAAHKYLIHITSGSSEIYSAYTDQLSHTVRFYIKGTYGYEWSVTALDNNEQALETAAGTRIGVTVNTDYTPAYLQAQSTKQGQLFTWQGTAPAYVITIGWNGNWYYQEVVTETRYLLTTTDIRTYTWQVMALDETQTYPISAAVEATHTATTPTGCNDIENDKQQDRKLMLNGQVLIIKDGKTYNIKGQPTE